VKTRGISRSRLDPTDQEPQPQPSIDVQESVEVSMAGGAECSVAPSAAPSDDGSNKSRSNSKDYQVEAVTGLVVRSNSADNFDKDGDEEFSPDGGAENVETHSVGSQLSRIQSRASLKKAGLFSDDKGNLRFVNLVVRNPCLFLFFFKFGGAQSLHVFFGILIIALVLSFLLVSSVIRSGQRQGRTPHRSFEGFHQRFLRSRRHVANVL
jgi:hypothetical protein